MNTNTEQTSELVDLARRIHAWQDRMGMKTPALIRQFPGIGSDKSFRDIRAGKTDGYDEEQQLANYRFVWAKIEAMDENASEDPVFEDLAAVGQIRLAVLRAMRNTGINRVVLALGGSGIGKSTFLRWFCTKYGSRIIRVDALDLWKDSPNEMLGAIMRATGSSGLPHHASERFDRVVETLRKTRRCLAIDEAHHLGPHCINTIKAIVNATPGEVLLLAMETLWYKLESTSYSEARQISTNRLCERVQLRLTKEDVNKFLVHSFPSADRAQLKASADFIRSAAEGSGNMLFVKDVTEQARDMTEDGSQPDVALFNEAVKAVCLRRLAHGRR